MSANNILVTTPEFLAGRLACLKTSMRWGPAASRPGPGLKRRSAEFQAGYRDAWEQRILPLLSTEDKNPNLLSDLVQQLKD